MDGNSIQNLPVMCKHSKRHLFKILCVIAAIILVISGIVYYQSGAPYLIDRVRSPSGSYELLVYNCDVFNKGLHLEKNTDSLVCHGADGEESANIIFDGIYQDIVWTDDSTKVALNSNGGRSNIIVINLPSGYCQSVDISLKYIFSDEINSHPESGFTLRNTKNVGIENQDFQFLMWAPDGNSMLIQFKVTDTTGKQRNGYFRYAYDSCKISDLQLF